MTGERDLRELLEDAVADVEPAERLDDIRARVVVPPPRRWGYGVGGAVLAVAATVTAVAVVTLPGDDRPDAGTPAATASMSPTPTSGRHPTAVYYLGETDAGIRLFREFHRSAGPTSALGPELAAPADPDYRTLWAADDLGPVTNRDDEVRVELRRPLADAPAGATAEQTRISIQQVVYTVQAQIGRRLPVRFVYDGQPVDRLLGISLTGPVEALPSTDVLASVQISDPTEGEAVTGSFAARGAANVNEGTVQWRLERDGAVLREGFATASGSITRHFPWETTVDVSGLEPGTYTFVATSQDVSDGEGFAPDEDTRTVVVE